MTLASVWKVSAQIAFLHLSSKHPNLYQYSSVVDSLGNDVVTVGDDLVLIDVKVAVEPDGPVALLLDDGMVLYNDCGGVSSLGLGALDAAILFWILVLYMAVQVIMRL